MADANDLKGMGASGRAALDAWLEMKAERDAVATELARITEDRNECSAQTREALRRIDGLQVRYELATNGRREANARVAALEAHIKTHDHGCELACGIGASEATGCGYRPYFIYNGRRCPDCPKHDMIGLPEETPSTLTRCTCGASDRTSHAIGCAAMLPGGFIQGNRNA